MYYFGTSFIKHLTLKTNDSNVNNIHTTTQTY